MNITEIVEAFVHIFVVIVSLVVIPYIKEKVGAENMASFLKWVDIAVAAAEQLYESTEGEMKKNYVLNYLTTMGYEINERELDMAIEAAVNRLHYELYGGVTK